MVNREMQIVECPRDAMQGLTQYISTPQKAHYINSLIKPRFPRLKFSIIYHIFLIKENSLEIKYK